jgi:hypothetical protein
MPDAFTVKADANGGSAAGDALKRRQEQAIVTENKKAAVQKT